MIKVKTTNEVATSRDPAAIDVYDDDQLVTKYIAIIRYRGGADGDHYPVVEFINNDPPVEALAIA